MIKFLKFVAPEALDSILRQLRFGAQGLEAGSTYAQGLTKIDEVLNIVTGDEVKRTARELLACDGPFGFLSLTALTVEPGSKGMPEHVDYPHFHLNCRKQPPLAAQFILSLDGTTGGAAPTWVSHPTNVVVLEPGDLYAFRGNMFHGVLPNVSSRSRTNLLWSIGPSWVKPMQASLFNMTFDEVTVKELMVK